MDINHIIYITVLYNIYRYEALLNKFDDKNREDMLNLCIPLREAGAGLYNQTLLTLRATSTSASDPSSSPRSLPTSVLHSILAYRDSLLRPLTTTDTSSIANHTANSPIGGGIDSPRAAQSYSNPNNPEDYHMVIVNPPIDKVDEKVKIENLKMFEQQKLPQDIEIYDTFTLQSSFHDYRHLYPQAPQSPPRSCLHKHKKCSDSNSNSNSIKTFTSRNITTSCSRDQNDFDEDTSTLKLQEQKFNLKTFENSKLNVKHVKALPLAPCLEPLFTNCTVTFCGTLDYIFYSNKLLTRCTSTAPHISVSVSGSGGDSAGASGTSLDMGSSREFERTPNILPDFDCTNQSCSGDLEVLMARVRSDTDTDASLLSKISASQSCDRGGRDLSDSLRCQCVRDLTMFQLPSLIWPSDHCMLKATFVFK